MGTSPATVSVLDALVLPPLQPPRPASTRPIVLAHARGFRNCLIVLSLGFVVLHGLAGAAGATRPAASTTIASTPGNESISARPLATPSTNTAFDRASLVSPSSASTVTLRTLAGERPVAGSMR